LYAIKSLDSVFDLMIYSNSELTANIIYENWLQFNDWTANSSDVNNWTSISIKDDN